MATKDENLDLDLPQPPPSIPGPQFAIVDGALDLVHGPSPGLNLSRLQKVIPSLQEAIQAAVQALSRSGNAHPEVVDQLKRYLTLLDGEVADLDYELIALRGVFLRNAEAAAAREIAGRMSPDMEDHAQAALRNVLDLHSIAMLSTDVGREILAGEMRFEQTPAEARRFEAAAIDFADSINESDVATTDAKQLLIEATHNFGGGPQPERSSLVGTWVVGSAGMALLGGAALVALPQLALGALGWASVLIAGEGVKRSKVGQSAANALKDILDDPRELLKVRDWVLSHDKKLRALAGKRREFRWMQEWLDVASGSMQKKKSLQKISEEVAVRKFLLDRFEGSQVESGNGTADLVVTRADLTRVLVSISTLTDKDSSGLISEALHRLNYSASSVEALAVVIVPKNFKTPLSVLEPDGPPQTIVYGHFEGRGPRLKFVVNTEEIYIPDELPQPTIVGSSELELLADTQARGYLVVERLPLFDDASLATAWQGKQQGLRVERSPRRLQLGTVAVVVDQGYYSVGQFLRLAPSPDRGGVKRQLWYQDMTSGNPTPVTVLLSEEQLPEVEGLAQS